MKTKFLIGSSWSNYVNAPGVILPPAIPPPNPPPDGGTDPDPEDPPPIDPEVTNWSDWADALSPVAKFKVVNGALIDAMGGQGGSFFGTGMLQPQQPSMLVDDEAPYSFGIDGNIWGEIPSRADMNLPAMSVIVVFQRRTLATYPWMNIVTRDDRIGNPSTSQEGGWSLSVTNAGAPRWSVRPAGLTAVVIAGADASVPAGEIVMLAATTGPGGMELFLNGVSVATDAATLGTALTSSVLQIGTYRSGGSSFNGAIQEVIIVPSQLDETAAAAGYAFVKSEVRWANDFSASVQEGFTTDVDVIPKCLMASAAPTITITAQPTNATAAVVNGKIRITGVTA